MHSNSSAEALQRLKAFGIPREDLNAVDLIVVQKRISFLDKKTREQKELRKITEIAEVADGKVRVLFFFNPRSARMERTRLLSQSPLVKRVLLNYGFSEKEFWTELERRRKFLQETDFADFKDFTLKAQDFAFGSSGKSESDGSKGGGG